MVAITRAYIGGLGVRRQCCGNIRLSGNARGRCLCWSFGLGRGGRRRWRSDYRNRMNGSRQNRQTPAQRTLAAPMTPLSVGPPLAAAVTAAATIGGKPRRVGTERVREHRDRDRRGCPLGQPGGDVERFGPRLEALGLLISNGVACLDGMGDIVTATASQACYGVTYLASK
jgi:hypothetical protein